MRQPFQSCKLKNCYFLLLMGLFLPPSVLKAQTCTCYDYIYLNDDANRKHTQGMDVYISPDLPCKDILLRGAEQNSEGSFSLFSHGKPGYLLLDGKWKNAAEIGDWLSRSNRLNRKSHLNIYGCEFAKGETGRAAVAYLEAALGVSVAASDDVTGVDGDWELEVGSRTNPISVHGFKFNLQSCTQPSAITLSQTAPTCTGATANNNGTITLTSATNADKWGISTLNAGTYDGNNYAAATAYAVNTVVKTAVPNTGGTYILRLFNGADGCFKDTTITVTAVNCSTCSACSNMISNGSFETFSSAFTFPVTFNTNTAQKISSGNAPANGWIAATENNRPVWLINDTGNTVNNPHGSYFVYAKGQYDCLQYEDFIGECEQPVAGGSYRLCFSIASWNQNMSGSGSSMTPTTPGTSQTSAQYVIDIDFTDGTQSQLGPFTIPSSSSWNNLNWQNVCHTLTHATKTIKSVYISQDSNGPGFALDNVKMTKSDYPHAGFDEINACTGGSPVSTSLSAQPTSAGTWTQALTNPAGAVIASPSSSNTTVNNLGSGLYHFIWTVSGCSDTVAVTVNCLCTQPSAITLSQTPATCTGATANNNGTITLTSATNADKWGISTLNATSYNGNNYASATAYAANTVVKTAVPNTGGTYILRLFNGADGCFKDTTLTVAAATCMPLPPTTNCCVSPVMSSNGDFESSSTNVFNNNLGGYPASALSGNGNYPPNVGVAGNTATPSGWGIHPDNNQSNPSDAVNMIGQFYVNAPNNKFIWIRGTGQCISNLLSYTQLQSCRKYRVCVQVAGWSPTQLNGTSKVPDGTVNGSIDIVINGSLTENPFTLSGVPSDIANITWQTIQVDFTTPANLGSHFEVALSTKQNDDGSDGIIYDNFQLCDLGPANPVVSVTPMTQTICQGGSVSAFVATAVPSSGTTYRWYGPFLNTTTAFGTSIGSAASFTPTVAQQPPVGQTRYYAVVARQSTCWDTAFVSLTINAAANAGADGSTSVCDNSTTAINLFSLITGEQSGGTWTRTTGSGGTFNAGAGTFTPAAGATSSTFTYTVTGTTPCPNDASVATVNISPAANAGADGSTSVCDNSTSAIDLFSLITGEQSGGTWTRTTGTGGTFNAGAGTFTPAAGATSSTFTYTVTGTAPCLDDASVATVNINPAPSAITLSQTAPTCTGATANNNGTITLTSATNATKWGISTLNAASYDGNNYASATAYAANTVVKTAIPNTGGTYTLRLFNGADGCYKDTTITVTAVTCSACALTLAVSATNITTQGGMDGTATVSASGGALPYSYVWSNGQTSQTATNLTSGVYQIIVTDNVGCKDTAMVTTAYICPTAKILYLCGSNKPNDAAVGDHDLVQYFDDLGYNITPAIPSATGLKNPVTNATILDGSGNPADIDDFTCTIVSHTAHFEYENYATGLYNTTGGVLTMTYATQPSGLLGMYDCVDGEDFADGNIYIANNASPILPSGLPNASQVDVFNDPAVYGMDGFQKVILYHSATCLGSGAVIGSYRQSGNTNHTNYYGYEKGAIMRDNTAAKGDRYFLGFTPDGASAAIYGGQLDFNDPNDFYTFNGLRILFKAFEQACGDCVVCTQPSAITLSQTPATCTGATSNNDGSITLTSATNADKWGISTLNAASYDGNNYASATAYAANTVVKTAIPNTGGTYTLRLFNGADGCYKDTTITVATVTCTAPCSITATFTQGSCNNNGTTATGTDDYFTITVSAVSATNGGTSGKYEVILNGTVLNTGGTNYGTSVTVGTPTTFKSDGATTYQLKVRDLDIPSCETTVFTTTASAACSTVPCPPQICLPVTVTRN